MRTGPSAGIVFRLVGYLAVFHFRDDMTAAVPTLSFNWSTVDEIAIFLMEVCE
jgi:hypothetical protein